MALRTLYDNLIEAALDQPNPTPELRKALNAILTATDHETAEVSERQKQVNAESLCRGRAA